DAQRDLPTVGNEQAAHRAESRLRLAERTGRRGGSGSSLPRLTDPGGGTSIAVRLRLGVALLVATVVCATAGTARAGTSLIVTGHGWGHGVGPRLGFPVRRHGAGFSFGHVAVLDCPRAPLTFDGREYHGTLVLWSRGGGVSVVNGLSLDTYLRGVVPSESPSHWPLAALEAQ